MQLSLHADYALRVLLYLGTREGEVISTRQISDAYGISKHHLVRVVQTLGAHGYVELLPGRSGGVRLARPPAEIRLGDVVGRTEANLSLVECFDPATNTCPIIHTCGLKHCLGEALTAFLDSLNRHTLAELLTAQRRKALTVVFAQARGRAVAPAAAAPRGSAVRPRPPR
ncbi:MAG TPA: Rrf2 family transcriptional regulator [Vicinamibacterales bacterium]|nr:Rrf2 family transcriptional regulator [Vicinamibacterales bacterium]